MLKPFLITDAPLDGTNLIESSAGTGKTYTIAGLFLRLVAERGVAVNQILVVTFTEAATEELKGRIRRRLHDLLSVLDSRDELEIVSGGSKAGGHVEDVADVDDELISALLSRVPLEDIRMRVEAALLCFDEAAIHTIHGFCHLRSSF